MLFLIKDPIWAAPGWDGENQKKYWLSDVTLGLQLVYTWLFSVTKQTLDRAAIEYRFVGYRTYELRNPACEIPYCKYIIDIADESDNVVLFQLCCPCPYEATQLSSTDSLLYDTTFRGRVGMDSPTVWEKRLHSTGSGTVEIPR